MGLGFIKFTNNSASCYCIASLVSAHYTTYSRRVCVCVCDIGNLGLFFCAMACNAMQMLKCLVTWHLAFHLYMSFHFPKASVNTIKASQCKLWKKTNSDVAGEMKCYHCDTFAYFLRLFTSSFHWHSLNSFSLMNKNYLQCPSENNAGLLSDRRKFKGKYLRCQDMNK